jgi:cytochrome P450
MAAGHETTSNALVWTIHLLTIHTKFQDRLRDEAIGSLNAETGELDPSVVDRLPILDKMFREVMRLYAPSTNVTRMAIHDVEICGVTIPKGTEIMLLPAAINRNPCVWGPNCESFDPDRWDHLEGEAAGQHAWATFFLGPRRCIGQEFVRKEFKYLLAALVTRFRFEKFEDKPIPLVNPSPVLRPKGGLRVRVFGLELGK